MSPLAARPTLRVSLLLLSGLNTAACCNAAVSTAVAPAVDTALAPAPQPVALPTRGAAATNSTPTTLRVFNVLSQQLDPRWERLPKTLSRVELTPSYTLRAVVTTDVKSVRFVVDGQARLDTTAPFQLTENDKGQAQGWAVQPGAHNISVTTFGSADGKSQELSSDAYSFAVTTKGTDPTPETGAHRRHAFWVTSSGQYVTRSAIGDFINATGKVVLAHGDVVLKEEEEEQGRFVTTTPAAERIEFAFQVLLPEGYDAKVKYPALVFLHHGWHVFRGTDNDGRMFKESPLFKGELSLESSALRHRFPAIIIVPQMIKKETIAGIEHEWAAFTDLSNETGSVKSADAPSRSAQYTFSVLDDLLSNKLLIAGSPVNIEPSRVYLTGHSMGGLGTWDFLARSTPRWAAAIPMAGYPDPSAAAQLKQMPIWAFHHEIDCYNPIIGTRTMHNQLASEKQLGLMHFTTLHFDTEGKCDQAHFRTPAAAWAEPALLPWLFSQVKTL